MPFGTAAPKPLGRLSGVSARNLAAVASDGWSIGIMGPNGSGKTSLALKLIDRDYRLVTDDLLAVSVDGHQAQAHPSFPQVQGGRQVFSIDLSISDLVDNIRRPDPEQRLEGNRRINVSHAKSFARYIIDYGNWTVPPLLLRVPSGELSFEALREIGGAEWGLLKIPRAARDELNIVDGQHRVLGAHMAREILAGDLRKARDHLARTKSNGELPHVISDAETAVKDLKEIRQRFETERMTLQIVEEDDPDEYRQMLPTLLPML